MTTDLPSSFAEYIQTCRQALGLQGQELARRAWLDSSTITKLEKGQLTRIKAPALLALARALQVPLAEMFEQAGLSAQAAQVRAEDAAAAESADPLAGIRGLPVNPTTRHALLTIVRTLLREQQQSADLDAAMRERITTAIARMPEGSIGELGPRSLTQHEQAALARQVLEALRIDLTGR